MIAHTLLMTVTTEDATGPRETTLPMTVTTGGADTGTTLPVTVTTVEGDTDLVLGGAFHLDIDGILEAIRLVYHQGARGVTLGVSHREGTLEGATLGVCHHPQGGRVGA